MEKEIWKDIDGYGGQYQVSNLGRVRSFRIKSEGVVLVPRMDRCGYYRVRFCGKNRSLHRLVALAFVDGYREGLQVNHKNEKKDDNRACNLEWITIKENVNYGTRTKRAVKGISKSLSVAVCQYDMNGNLIAKYPSITIAAKETGINSKLISRVCCGNRYHAGGYGWSYQHDYRRKYAEKKRYNIPHIEYDTTSLEGEQWKDIAGYNGMYLVSNLGRIKSIDYNNVTFHAGRIMTLQKVYRHGKLYTIKVSLCCGAKRNKPRVCRLVADAFLSGYKKGFVLNHINGNVSDNRAENLEWVPYSQMNQSGRFRENTATIAKRKAIIQMTLDGKFVAEHESLAAASKAVGAAHDNIRCVCIGKKLSCKGYKWKFKNDKK